MDTVLEVDDLRKRYGDKKAVDGVGLHLDRGEILGVLGPNGAGKTTTVEICEGYRRRDSGTVRVLGQDPQHGDRLWRSKIGVVLQTANDLGEATVAEVVTHFAGFYPDPRDPGELIAAVGLHEKAKARVGTLSGGQRRRLDVALGIVGRPEILFLDEPTTGFDPQARRDFWSLIDQLRETTSILLTTHYLEEAEQLADRLVVVASGRIVAEGRPAELGGRADAPATVRWVENGTEQETQTQTPTRMVAELSARLGSDEIEGLQVHRPTLEDIYLGLIDQTQDEVA
jgi:ABC-2 type transport system ATP-binding protein